MDPDSGQTHQLLLNISLNSVFLSSLKCHLWGKLQLELKLPDYMEATFVNRCRPQLVLTFPQ